MIALKHHKGMSIERWFSFSIAMQLANVSSEVGRTFIAKRAGLLEDARLACERALELMALTLADPKNKKRRRELLRARSGFADHVLGINEWQSTDEQWENYFHQFGYAAALERQQARMAKLG